MLTPLTAPLRGAEEGTCALLTPGGLISVRWHDLVVHRPSVVLRFTSKNRYSSLAPG